MTTAIVFAVCYAAAYFVGYARGRDAAHRQRTRELDLRCLGRAKRERWQRLV